MELRYYFFSSQEKEDNFLNVINNHPKLPLQGSGDTPMTKWVEQGTKLKSGGSFIPEIPQKILTLAGITQEEVTVLDTLHDGYIFVNPEDILEEEL